MAAWEMKHCISYRQFSIIVAGQVEVVSIKSNSIRYLRRIEHCLFG